MASDTEISDKERCPLPRCEGILGGGHWLANPNPDSPHLYHTDKEGVARHWEHIDGMDVTPETEPFPEGTVGHNRSLHTDS